MASTRWSTARRCSCGYCAAFAKSESFRDFRRGENMSPQAPQVLWQPSAEAIEQAQVTQFARQVIRKHRLDCNTYPDFWKWTVEQPEQFWSEVWDFCGVIASRKSPEVLVDAGLMP